VQHARDEDIDLVVVATHGRSGLKHALIGSVAEKIVQMAPCPVLTVKHPEHEFVMP
jgi:nucleotide-binding universal stress UspA family protein